MGLLRVSPHPRRVSKPERPERSEIEWTNPFCSTTCGCRPRASRGGGTLYLPAIVEREEAVPLDVIIERAIDRGLIAGIKPSAAKQIADAIAQQMYEEFKAGRGVKFGNYFYARLYLDGTSATAS